MFLSGNKEQFSLFDFSSHLWKQLNDLGAADKSGDATATIPGIVLDLWFEVTEPDLYLVLPILPSSAWEGKEVGLRIEFGARSTTDLLHHYREAKTEAQNQLASLGDSSGTYIPWPKTLTDFLEKELQREFEFRYFVLDRSQFDSEYRPVDGYSPELISGEPSGAAILKSLLRVDCLYAQRHLADKGKGSAESAGRAEDLSRRLSRFYKRNLQQRPDDHSALKALSESEASLDKHLMEVFKPTLKRIAKLGYRPTFAPPQWPTFTPP